MRILVLAADVSSLITEIRLAGPLGVLAAAEGWTLQLRPYHACVQSELRQADVVIAQRPCSARHLALLRRARRERAALVVEMDDLLTDVAPHLLHHATLCEKGGQVEAALGLADGVTASTAVLADALAAHARHRLVVPNQALPCADALPQPVPGAAACVLVAASDRLWPCELAQALQRLQSDRPQAWRIVAVGPAADGVCNLGLQVENHPLMPRADFVALARSLPNVVAAIPLDNSRFSACKSAVKWFDYAEAGVPTVASRVSPYREVIEDGRTGRLVDAVPGAPTAAAWAAALSSLAEDQAHRQAVQAAARAAVRQHHTMAHTVAAWRAALDLALAQRALRPADLQGPAAALQGAWGDAVAQLRQWNRERLARR